MAAKSDKALRNYTRAVTNVFTSYYAKLSSAVEGTMDSFASKAYSAGLISSPVMKNKNFSSIYEEFKVGLELCKSISEVQKRWKSLTDILEDLGGPAGVAGKDLKEKLSSLTVDQEVESGPQSPEDTKNDTEVVVETPRSRQPRDIFEAQFADLCDAIEADPLRIVNKLISAGLLSQTVRNDVTSMTGTAYEKANKIVIELQRQLNADDNPAEFLKKISEFLESQSDRTLKKIGEKIKNSI